jgi:hypothetical protein
MTDPANVRGQRTRHRHAIRLDHPDADTSAWKGQGPSHLIHTYARYARFVRFSFLILIGRFVTLESRSFRIFMIVLASDTFTVVFRGAIIAAATPDQLRGRVMAADYAIGAGGGQLGNLEAGTLGSLTPPTISALTGGLVTIAAAVVIGLALPTLTCLLAASVSDDGLAGGAAAVRVRRRRTGLGRTHVMKALVSCGGPSRQRRPLWSAFR